MPCARNDGIFSFRFSIFDYFAPALTPIPDTDRPSPITCDRPSSFLIS